MRPLAVTGLRHAFRSVFAARGIAAVAIATLAVGIGATTTMFSAMYAALLRPLPFADPTRLVLLFTTRTTPDAGRVLLRWSRPMTATLEQTATSFDSIASVTSTLVAVSGGRGDPEQIAGEVVSPDYFATLGVVPALGRTFSPAEDGPPGTAPVAMLGHRLWRARYGADPSIVGTTVRVNEVSLTVVGVLPAGFSGLSDTSEIWIPRAMAPLLTYEGYLTTPQRFIAVVARLKRTVTIEQANAELMSIGVALVDRDGRGEARWGAVAQRLGDARIDPAVRRSVLLLFAAAACVLLITCANVAGLQLARGRVRRRELAIRLAVGSSRGAIVRQLLAESLMLAAPAGVAGTALALWGVDLFARSAPAVLMMNRVPLSPFASPALDVRALLFVVALTLTTSILCGIAPALATSRIELVTALRDDDRTGGSDRRRPFRALVVGEIAVAVLLLASAAVLLDNFADMQKWRRGFEADEVITFWIRPPTSRYAVTGGLRIVERLLTSIERVRGVESAAVNRCTPFTGCARTVLFFTDRSNDPLAAPVVGRHYVSADYFRTLGIRVLAGRALTRADRTGRPAVAVIDETAARRFWPGADPIGKRVWFGTTTGPFSDRAHAVEIVGIVEDVKYELPDSPDSAPRPEFFTSYLQFSFPDTMMLVKTRESASTLVPALRRAVASVDPDLPIYDVLTLNERITGALARPRFNTVLVGTFAVAALALAALGVYGMLSYSVSSRRHEIGVRLALGATPQRVIRSVVGDALRLACLGVVIGGAAGFSASRLMQGCVLGVAPAMRVVPLVGGVMLVVACAAALLPARRASAVEPASVLRGV